MVFDPVVRLSSVCAGINTDEPVGEIELEVLRVLLDLFPIGLMQSMTLLPTDSLR